MGIGGARHVRARQRAVSGSRKAEDVWGHVGLHKVYIRCVEAGWGGHGEGDKARRAGLTSRRREVHAACTNALLQPLFGAHRGTRGERE